MEVCGWRRIRVCYTFGADDKFTLRGLIFFAPDYNQSGFTGTYVAGGGRVKLWKRVGVYAGAGYQFFEDPKAFEQLVWTASISYYWKSFTFDVRYWDIISATMNACSKRI